MFGVCDLQGIAGRRLPHCDHILLYADLNDLSGWMGAYVARRRIVLDPVDGLSARAGSGLMSTGQPATFFGRTRRRLS
jgi:hypothetical protein